MESEVLGSVWPEEEVNRGQTGKIKQINNKTLKKIHLTLGNINKNTVIEKDELDNDDLRDADLILN